MKLLVEERKNNMGLDTQNEKLKKMLCALIDTNIAIMDFQMTVTKEEKDIEISKKLIEEGEKAKKVINGVSHNEILVDIYNMFIVGNMPFFIAAAHVMADENKIVKWDKDEEGFQEFLHERELAFAKCDKELEEKKLERERIEKARAEGKNVELMYKDGKVKYVIVEEKPN